MCTGGLLAVHRAGAVDINQAGVTSFVHRRFTPEHIATLKRRAGSAGLSRPVIMGCGRPPTHMT